MPGFLVNPATGKITAAAVLALLAYLIRSRDDEGEAENLVPLSSGAGQWVLGEAATAGRVADYAVTDDGYNERGPRFNILEDQPGLEYNDLHMAIPVSEGACDGIPGVFFGDRYYDLTPVRTDPDGSILYAPVGTEAPYVSNKGSLFLVRANFDASGTQGEAFRSRAGNTSGTFLKGISWVHLVLRQPSNADDDDRAHKWASRPNVRFVVRGVKVPDAVAGGAPRWTDSATDLYHWFLTSVMGVDADTINDASVVEAKAVTDAVVSTVLDGTYWQYAVPPDGPEAEAAQWSAVEPVPTASNPITWIALRRVFIDHVGSDEPTISWRVVPYKVRRANGTVETLFQGSVPSMSRYRLGTTGYSSKRYTFNGVVSAGQSPQQILSDMDFAWQGAVVNDGSELHFRPGADRDASFAWTADSIDSRESTPGGSLAELGNVFQSSLVNSLAHDYKRFDLPALEDTAEITAEELRRTSQVRPMALVTHPVTGGRLLATFARRARRDVTYEYRFRPSQAEAAQWYGARVSDVITVTDGFYGITGRRMVISDIAFDEEGTVSLILVDSPLGAYADTIHLPDQEDRIVEIVDAPPDTPTNVEVSVAGTVRSDGSYLPRFNVSWDASQWRAQVDYRAVNLGADIAGVTTRVPPGFVGADPDADDKDQTETAWKTTYTSANMVSVDVEWGYEWEARVRLFNRYGTSDWSDPESIEAPSQLDESPVVPRVHLSDNASFSCGAPKRRDIVAVEIELSDRDADGVSVGDVVVPLTRYPVVPGEAPEFPLNLGNDIYDLRLVDFLIYVGRCRYISNTGSKSDFVAVIPTQQDKTGVTVPPDGHVIRVPDQASLPPAGIKGRLAVSPTPSVPVPTPGDEGLDQAQVDARVRAGVADWAETGDTSAIPARKLVNAPKGDGLTQAQVDARVKAGVLDWAETGNTAKIPAAKLPEVEGGGGVKQVVSGSSGGGTPLAGPWTDAASVDITPSAESHILLLANATVGGTSFLRVVRSAGGVVTRLVDLFGPEHRSGNGTVTLSVFDAPNTSSKVTYKLQWSNVAGGTAPTESLLQAAEFTSA